MVNFLRCDKGLGYVKECTYPYKIHDKILRSMAHNVRNLYSHKTVCVYVYIYTLNRHTHTYI